MILVLGGTTEGRELCAELDRRGTANLLSLAGRTTDPLATESVRVGGFGGTDGLAEFLISNGIGAVVDATHPFAEEISRNAALACSRTGVPLLRIERPGWALHPEAEAWLWVGDHGGAAAAVAALGRRRVLLTVGRQHTLDYAPALADHFVLARVAEPPRGTLPAAWELELARGPFSLDGERRLFQTHGIDCLVTKDSGGAATSAKLAVAAERGATVVVVGRPTLPPGVELVADAKAALAWLEGREVAFPD